MKRELQRRIQNAGAHHGNQRDQDVRASRAGTRDTPAGIELRS